MNEFKEKNPEMYEEMVNQICDRIGCDPDEVKEAKNVRDDLGFDSLDEIEMIMDCEQMFGITITDDEAEATNGDMLEICNGLQRAVEKK